MDRGTKVGPTSTVYKSDRGLAAGSVVVMDKKPSVPVNSTTKPVRSKSTAATLSSSNGSAAIKWNSGSSSSSVGSDGKQNSAPSSSSIDLGDRRNSAPPSTSNYSNARRNSSTSSKVGREKGGVPARVRVAVRIRPRNAEEMAADVDLADCLELQPETKKLKLLKNNWDSDTYQFDEVLTETSSQKRVYEAVAKPVVESVCQGYNGTVMAYGQSGTGKTFTLGRLGDEDTAERGIMVRALEDILADVTSSDGTVTVSYLQLYMESVQDLLDPGKKESIAIVEDSKTGDVSVPGATQVELKDQRTFLELLETGEANRLAANTKLNTESSRSHAILLVSLRKVVKPIMGELNENGEGPHLDHGMQPGIVRKSKLLIVDLAGSERIDKSGSEGHTLEEAKFINLSLTALGKCINAIAENSPHVPIRDSKLTRMLRDSFGGTARTSLIVTIGPSPRHRGETASTIGFGQRAMKVENVAKLKEEFDYRSLCRKLEIELDRVTADYERQCKAKQEAIEHFERRLEEDAEAAAERLAAALNTREQAEERLRKENADIVDNLKRAEQELKDIAEENLRLGREQAERDKDFERRLEEDAAAAADRLATALNTREQAEDRLRKENADVVDNLKRAEKELKDIAEENLRLGREQAERDKDFERRLAEDAEAAADRLATALNEREQEEERLRKENADMVDKLKRAEMELKDIAEENLRLAREQAERDKDFERRLEEDAAIAADRLATALKEREQEEERLRKENAVMVDKFKRAEQDLKDIAEENLRLGREQAERDKDFERRLEEDAAAASDRLAAALSEGEHEEETLRKENADMVDSLKRAEKELNDLAEENLRLGREDAEKENDVQRTREGDAEAAADRLVISLSPREEEDGRLSTEYVNMVDKLKRAEKELKGIAEENLRLGREQAERDKDFERRLKEEAEAAADRLAITLNTREQEEGRLRKEYAGMVIKLKKAEKALKDIAEENGRLGSESGSLQREQSFEKPVTEVQQLQPQQEMEIKPRENLEHPQQEMEIEPMNDLEHPKQEMEIKPMNDLEHVVEMEIKPTNDLEHPEQVVVIEPRNDLEQEVRSLKLQLGKLQNENEVILLLNGKLKQESKQREILEEKVRSLKEQLTLFSDRGDESISEVGSDRSSEGSQSSSVPKPMYILKPGHSGDRTINQSQQPATASKLFEQVGLLKISSLLDSEDLDVHVHAINNVAKLAAQEVNQEKIVEVGGLDSLLLLLDHSEHETISRAAAGAVANLAMSQTIQEHIASRGGIGILARAAHDAKNPQTLRVVGGAIANLCGNENLLVKLKEEGGIRALLRMGWSRHSGVLAQVARGIANFSKCESKGIGRGYQSTRSWLLDDGALPWIVANANNEASPIRRHIEIALCHLARHEVNSKDLVAGGALSELVRISQESAREDIRNLAQWTLNASNTFQTELKLTGHVHLAHDSPG